VFQKSEFHLAHANTYTIISFLLSAGFLIVFVSRRHGLVLGYGAQRLIPARKQALNAVAW
jgi:hypothetical protein